MVNICNPSYNAKWNEIEYRISSDLPLQAIIGDSGLVCYLKDINLWIKISARNWHRITSENKAKEPYWILRWIDMTQISFQIEWMQDLNSEQIEG